MGGFAARPARDRGGPGRETDAGRGKRADPSAQQQLLRLQRAAGNRAVTHLVGAADADIHRWSFGKTAAKAPVAEDATVRKALDHFAKGDKGKIEAAANAYAKAKKEGKDVEVGHGVKASGKAEGAVQAGAWGSAEVRKYVHSYTVLVNAGIVVGGGLKLEGELAREFGSVTAKLKGTIDAFAGAYAKAEGRLQASTMGVVATGKAEAFAGAKSSQKASIEFTRNSLGLEGEASAEEMAGAVAKAEGSFSLSKEEIAAAGEVSAFAGAKAKGSVGGKAKLYGREAFRGKVSGEVSAGAGGEARGGFRIRRGVIQIFFGANVTVGVGGGAAGDIAADLKPVAVWIWRQADKARWQRNSTDAENVLKAPDSVKVDLHKKVKAYAERKIRLLQANRADNFVKEEKVQAIIGNVLPRKQVAGRSNSAAIDAMIKDAVERALNEASGISTITAEIQNGKLTKLNGLPDPKKLKGKGMVSSVETGEALDAILLSDYPGSE